MTTLKPPFHAKDMEGLYKKVTRGYYQRIPTHFSQDLSNVIRAFLQVSPSIRPGCDKILQFPGVIKRMDDKILNEVDEANPEFMKTIIIPKNLHYLTERLPEPNYQPLKLKKIDKHNFLQTLGGYKDPETYTIDPKLEEIMKKQKRSRKSTQDTRKNLPSIKRDSMKGRENRNIRQYGSLDKNSPRDRKNSNYERRHQPRHAIEYSKRRELRRAHRNRQDRIGQIRRQDLHQKMILKYSTRNKGPVRKGYAYKVNKMPRLYKSNSNDQLHQQQSKNLLKNSPYLIGQKMNIYKSQGGNKLKPINRSRQRDHSNIKHERYAPNQQMIKKAKINNIMNAYNAKPDSIEQLRDKYAKLRKKQDQRKLNVVKYQRSRSKKIQKQGLDILDLYKSPGGKANKLEPIKKQNSSSQ